MDSFRFDSQDRIIVGCMRFADKTPEEMARFISDACGQGLRIFDHADIYGGGRSESVFGEALAGLSTLRREDLILQSKCGIRRGYYDLSREHILRSVEGSLRRLRTDYLDLLLLHRPDALVEPEEVAAAFDELERSGKVRAFGVSNHRPSQIELLKSCVQQELIVDQLQFSLAASGLIASGLIASGMEVDMITPDAADRDGFALDYCRRKGITIQTWSPFQMPLWRGSFFGAPEYAELNRALEEIAAERGETPLTIAAAWILRHPAKMQLISGSTNARRLGEICRARELRLSREEWYRLYLAAGHQLP